MRYLIKVILIADDVGLSSPNDDAEYAASIPDYLGAIAGWLDIVQKFV